MSNKTLMIMQQANVQCVFVWLLYCVQNHSGNMLDLVEAGHTKNCLLHADFVEDFPVDVELVEDVL